MKKVPFLFAFIFTIFVSACANFEDIKEFPYVGPSIKIGDSRQHVEKTLRGGPNQVTYTYNNLEVNSFMGINTKKLVARGFGRSFRIVFYKGVFGRSFFKDGVSRFVNKNGDILPGSGPKENRNYIITIFYNQNDRVRDIKYKEIYQPNYSGDFLSY